jgi:putative ABC transport system permease protein
MVQRTVLQELISSTGRLTMVYVKADRAENIPTLMNDLKTRLEEYQIYSMEEFLSLINVDNIPALKPFISVIIGLSVIFGFLVVFLSMYTAVLERTREIGILKALGASATLVAHILIRETALLALIGSALGIVFTFGTRWAIMSLFPATLVQRHVPDWWPITTGIALVAAMIGTLYPALKAARQDTVEALTYE